MTSNTKGSSISMRDVFILFLFLGFSITPSLNFSVAAAGVESTDACKQCGMDNTAFTQSRMVIAYADGTKANVCSIHCAAAELKQSRDRKVEALAVADYMTLGLIDAETATWVVGGKKEGVMTSVPKWAFAGEKDALDFIRKNGGNITSFAQAMKDAGEEADGSRKVTHGRHTGTGHDMSHVNMGAGAQMLFNPGFGDDIYHTHPAGMWMVNYKFMHMDMRGLRDGTSDVSVSDVIPMKGTKYGYMMAPTRMIMDMHMFMVMYGVSDRMTLMGMTNYLDNKMDMLMDMGKGKGPRKEPPMRTSGIGDTELRGIYRLSEYLLGSLGLSLPTGDIEKEFTTMGRKYRTPYNMQLGSGTYDLKPALTYTDCSEDAKWNWGAQTMYTWHTAKNRNDWRYGDSLKVTSWLQRAAGPATSWLRLAYNYSGRIKGDDPEIEKLLSPDPMKGASSPDADPRNYGGRRLDGLVGVSFQKGAFSVGVEGGIPLYQNLNGLQLKTDWLLNAGVQVMF